MPPILLRPALLALLAMAPVVQAHATDTGGHYPLTLDNCGTQVTIDAPPQRAVSIGQNTTEILLSLGLADRMAASAVWISDVPEALKAANDRVPRLSSTIPGFESVLGQKPDLVAAQFEIDVGPQGRIARREQFTSLGVPTYISPTDCVGRVYGGSSNADGARTQAFDMALVYREIEELADIFDVSERGNALVETLREREAHAVSKAAGIPKDLSMVWWFSSAQLSGDAWVAGTLGAPGYIMKTLGARNIIDSRDEWPAVSWERIAALDPDVIVLGEMTRRNFPADDINQKIAFLENDPVTREMSAVKHHRFIVLDAQVMNPTLRTVTGLETVAEGLSAMGLTESSAPKETP
ncbi:ABC transporter substrate-binding protein [Kushneria marisflavi]|uniref:ABC transporter substrate-binding protein n=1 Tax=Kushneria marisflavi TaxID=157779 RepID=A0A240UNK8_9GAMM|nr:ABC transporter substrate-binding protein [Kushneria marisflavi]ART63071.1 ABC transporter substrate-binding protein [Kushneria marisflavi]RKD84682.1 iron complex transport system substrate-binding protein [Kushneria marisflavi]